MKIPPWRLFRIVSATVLLVGVGFFCLDTLPVYSSVDAPVSTDTTETVTAKTNPQSPIPTPSPSAQPVSQPAPAGPSPKITVAATRSGNLLTIPSIGLYASVINVGLTPDNAIDVPAGHQVGFWTGSAAPGTPGATFLDGHVDGIFANLHRLGVGQTFSIRFNNQTFHYQVAHTETVALEGIDMNRALSPYNDAREGLNLMTCAGTYVPSIGTYDQRFVVYAVRINL